MSKHPKPDYLRIAQLEYECGIRSTPPHTAVLYEGEYVFSSLASLRQKQREVERIVREEKR